MGARPVVILAVLLGGCGNEWGLGELALQPGDDAPDVRPDRPDNPKHPGGGGGGNGGGGGPWGELDPGKLPEVYFAVALGYAGWDTAWGCCADCDTDGWGCGGGPTEYVVVDLKGQVVAQFTPPDPAFETWYAQHLQLRPAGPGQFLAVTWIPGMAPRDESGAADDADGFSASWNTWLAWRGDAVTGAATPLAQGYSDWVVAEAHVLGVERDVPLSGPYATVHLAMQADAPEGLLVWSGTEGCTSEPLQPIRSVHLSDPDAPDLAWQPDEVLPWPILGEGWQTFPTALRSGFAEDGSTSMLVGAGAWKCTYSAEQGWWLGAFDAEDALMWQHWLPNDVWPRTFAYSGFEGGAALHVSATTQPQRWTMYGPGAPLSGELDASLVNWRAGELLDPRGPTFLLVGTDPVTWTDQMVIWHAGKIVWRIDDLRYGLDRRPFHAAEVALIPPP